MEVCCALLNCSYHVIEFYLRILAKEWPSIWKKYEILRTLASLNMQHLRRLLRRLLQLFLFASVEWWVIHLYHSPTCSVALGTDHPKSLPKVSVATFVASFIHLPLRDLFIKHA